jgi:hypothetical protein
VGLDRAAELITDIASVYVIGASGVVAAYFGFNAMEANVSRKENVDVR